MVLDEEFLQRIGVPMLNSKIMDQFLDYLNERLSLAVGTHLSADMTDEMLEEFEKLIDRDMNVISAWLEEHCPDFESDPFFSELSKSRSSWDPGHLLAEYAAAKWLEVTRPNYRDVVLEEIRKIESEIKSVPQELLESSLQEYLTHEHTRHTNRIVK